VGLGLLGRAILPSFGDRKAAKCTSLHAIVSLKIQDRHFRYVLFRPCRHQSHARLWNNRTIARASRKLLFENLYYHYRARSGDGLSQ
jgi:hypothetical protein